MNLRANGVLLVLLHQLLLLLDLQAQGLQGQVVELLVDVVAGEHGFQLALFGFYGGYRSFVCFLFGFQAFHLGFQLGNGGFLFTLDGFLIVDLILQLGVCAGGGIHPLLGVPQVPLDDRELALGVAEVLLYGIALVGGAVLRLVGVCGRLTQGLACGFDSGHVLRQGGIDAVPFAFCNVWILCKISQDIAALLIELCRSDIFVGAGAGASIFIIYFTNQLPIFV